MTFSIGELITGGTLLAGIAATWATFNHRLGNLQEKLDDIRKDQGQRIGVVEDRIAIIDGYIMGASRYRKKTKPQGEQT